MVGNSSHLSHSALPNYDQERKECMKSTTASLLAVQDCVAISFKWSYFRYTPSHWLVFVMELKYAGVVWYVGTVLCQLPQILVLTLVL